MHERLLVRYARRRCRRSLEGFLPPCGHPRPPDRALLMYLHVPYCEEPCLYCSFHRVRFEEGSATVYYRTLRQEIRSYAARGFKFDSLSVGGGTPTVLPGELTETLLLARSLWPIRHLTVETNPSHLRAETVGLLRSAGVERLSVGVQTFRDDVLRALGRRHYGESAEIRALLEHASGAFRTLNVDLIYGFPGQTPGMAAEDAAVIRELGIPQVTFYPLMHAHGVRRELSRRMGYRASAPLADLYAAVRRGLGPSYRPSSAWCFSRDDGHPIDEYIVERDEYAGLGAGSFGYIGGTLWATTFSIPRYIEAVRRQVSPIILSRHYSRYERWEYRMLMSLSGGALHPRALVGAGGPRSALPLLAALGLLSACGVLRRERGSLRTTGRGQYLAVLLMKEFFEAVNGFRDTCRAASKGDGRV